MDVRHRPEVKRRSEVGFGGRAGWLLLPVCLEERRDDLVRQLVDEERQDRYNKAPKRHSSSMGGG